MERFIDPELLNLAKDCKFPNYSGDFLQLDWQSDKLTQARAGKAGR
jgi:hypothetical protein